MTFDERAWLGDPASETRKKRVPESAAAFAGRVHGARPFPVAAVKVLTLTSSDDFDVAAVVAALGSDVGLAGRVLRIVNSSAFGLRTRCKSIRQAVTLLGAKGVREATIAGAVLNLFPGNGSVAWTSLHDHAQTIGALARHLAPEWNVPADEMFIAAFLHDMGKWILLEQEAEYAEVLEAHPEWEGSLDEERGRFGFDHAELTEHMLTAWRIPQPIPRVVGLHHDPAGAYAESSSLAVRVAILRLADRLAHAMLTGEELDFDALASTEPMTYLQLSAQSLRERYAFLHRTLEDSEAAVQRRSSPMKAISAARSDVKVAPQEEEVCETCGHAAFGGRCNRCQARLCADHTPRAGGLCNKCEQAFEAELVSQRVASPRKALVLGGLGLTVALLSQALHHAAWPVLSVGVGLIVAAVIGTARRFSARARFLRSPSP